MHQLNTTDVLKSDNLPIIEKSDFIIKTTSEAILRNNKTKNNIADESNSSSNILNEEHLINNNNNLITSNFNQSVNNRQKFLNSTNISQSESSCTSSFNVSAFSPLNTAHSLIYPLTQSIDINLLNINEQSLNNAMIIAVIIFI